MLASIALAGALIAGLTGCGDADLATNSAAEPSATSAATIQPPASAAPDAPATDATAAPTPSASPSAATPAAQSDMLALLATIPVKGKAPMTGYKRTEMFGAAWLDKDGNHCGQRDDVLARDMTDEIKSGSCKVLTGTLADPYTGKTLNWARGGDVLVDIDHLVALGNVWVTGGQQLSQAQREQIANDPLNLLAVDGPANRAKGDGDAATWLPSNKSFRCTYVSAQVQVKAKYGLWVAPAEHDAIAGILANCGNPSYTPPAAPIVEQPAPQTPAPAPDAPAAGRAATIHPGSWCSTQGETGVAANGKTYTCGSKGPDKAGKFHWNS
ncbi:HNH endonuclease family protein [Leifsonia sp. Leaf264]|uniref:HNH endonuclease family protein n=1 Tax=Leifsonia sp. Leaf264 TaxID=1736314 RepID=UPI0009E9828D|nr:HNH endonuclease family protein [Leifsonia sp. Leaf264]